jgi:hypothetical protein
MVLSPLFLIMVYLAFCILVGICGGQRRMGFLGTFILSILFTPVLVLIVLLITGPSRRGRTRRAIDSLDR